MRTARLAATGVLAVAIGPSCNQQAARPPPLGEVLVVVDTDAAVPRLAGRLRVDLYRTDTSWYASRDVPAFKPGDWPQTFAVTLEDGEPARDVVVRLRAYPEGKTRDYLGERYQTRADPSTFCPQSECFVNLAVNQLFPCCPTAVPAPQTPFSSDCSTCPRLLDAQGNDLTPGHEPQPLLAIDALFTVHVAPGIVQAARVVLRSACSGTMADLSGGRACVDTAGQLAAVAPAVLDPDTTVARPSQLVGTFPAPYAAACAGAPRTGGTAADGTPLHDEEVCVPGGVFVLGGRSGALGTANDDLPERVAALPSFRMDRYEVTVARFRKALADGFGGVPPYANDGPLVLTGNAPLAQCTWSTSAMGREEYPVTCVTWPAANAFCRFAGGTLPSEAQWEYAAAVAQRDARTFFPWGNGNGRKTPCTQAVFGRSDATPGSTNACVSTGLGPAIVTTAQTTDVTPSGVVGLAGNVAEWTSDSFASLASACWSLAGLEAPGCTTGGPNETTRGGGWDSPEGNLLTTWRASGTDLSPAVGIRCVRPGGGS